MEPTSLTGVGRKLFSVIEFDDNEKLVYEIRKHPIGLIFIYGVGLFVSAAVFLALVGTAAFLEEDPVGIGDSFSTVRVVMVIAGSVLTLLALAMTAIGAYLYQSNVMLVTTEKIAQVLYRTIFDRKISQLSIGDVQDVTVTQKGVLSRLFGYGTVVIETAGEQQNYTFTFTPNPYQASKAIVNAHEENLKSYGN